MKWRSGGSLLGTSREGERVPIYQEKKKQRRDSTKSMLSNQLPLWEPRTYPMAVLGSRTEYRRGEGKEVGY